jgi:hypothetical protein
MSPPTATRNVTPPTALGWPAKKRQIALARGRERDDHLIVKFLQFSVTICSRDAI